jgi:Ca2+-binding EF-hand superfamily protein
MDRRYALAQKNLKLAFHHFQDKNGYITRESLHEVFKREGKNLSEAELKEMMDQIEHKDEQKISYTEFCNFMQGILVAESLH